MFVDGLVEGSGEVCYVRGGFYGLRVVGDGDALAFDVHFYLFGRDDASPDQDVLEHVARGIVVAFVEPSDLVL